MVKKIGHAGLNGEQYRTISGIKQRRTNSPDRLEKLRMGEKAALNAVTELPVQ
jgi:hypothetical protein